MANDIQRIDPSWKKRLLPFGIILFAISVFVISLLWGWTNRERFNELARTSTVISDQSNTLATAKANVEAEKSKTEKQLQLTLARQLAGQAQAVFYDQDANLPTAILLAVQSMRILPTGDASQTLLDNTLAYPVFLFRQSDDVRDVAFSPDGNYFASASDDHFVRVWDVSTGREILHLTYDAGASTLAFSQDSQQLLSGGCDQMDLASYTCQAGSIRVWNLSTGKEITRIEQKDRVQFIGLSPNGQDVVSGGCLRLYGNELPCSDASVRLWRLSTEREIAQLKHNHHVSAFAFSPDGDQIATGGCDKEELNTQCSSGSIRIWDASTGDETMLLSYENDVTSVAFSPDGKYVVAGSRDNTAQVWDLATGTEQARVNHGYEVSTALFSRDGQFVISADNSGMIRVWNAATGAEVTRMQHGYGILPIILSSDGRYLASAARDGTARVWELSNGKEKARMIHDGFLSAIAFSPDGLTVVSGGEDGTVRVWKSTHENEFARSPHRDYVRFVLFMPDGKHAVSGSEDGTVRIWELSTGAVIASRQHGVGILSLALSPDGQQVVSGSVDGTVEIWEPFTNVEPVVLAGDFHGESLAFSPDGRFIAAAGVPNILIWNADTQEEVTRIPFDNFLYSAIFSWDGRYLVTGSLDHTIRIWDVSTGEQVANMLADVYASALAISPDGKLIATTGYSTLDLWDAETHQRISQVGVEDSIASIAFSPDGNYLLTGGGYTVRIWDVHTGSEVSRVLHQNIRSVAFSPDGKLALSGSYFDTVRVWKWHPEDIIADACSRLTRNMTWSEWNQYVGSALPYQASCPDLPIESQPATLPFTTPTATPANTPFPN